MSMVFDIGIWKSLTTYLWIFGVHEEMNWQIFEGKALLRKEFNLFLLREDFVQLEPSAS